MKGKRLEQIRQRVGVQQSAPRGSNNSVLFSYSRVLELRLLWLLSYDVTVILKRNVGFYTYI